MKLKISMQKNNDGGDTIIGRGKPKKAFRHALKLLRMKGNNVNKIIKEMTEELE